MKLAHMGLIGLMAGWFVVPGLAQAAPVAVDMATISMSAPGMPRTVTNTVCASDGNDLVCDRGVYITSSSRVGIGNSYPDSNLNILEAVSLSSAPGAVKSLLAVDNDVGNYSRFSLTSRRHTAGNNWESTNLRLQRTIDVTPQGFIDFGVDGATGDQGKYGLGFGSGNTTHVVIARQGQVGIGVHDPAAPLHVSGSILVQNGEITQSGLSGGYGSFRSIHGNYGVLLRNDGTDFYMLQTASGDQYGTWNDTRPFGFNLATGHVFLAARPSTSVLIGAQGVPSAKLDVKGTLRVSNGSEACDSNLTGAIRFTGGDFSFCRNGAAWETLTSLGGGGGSTPAGPSRSVQFNNGGVLGGTGAVQIDSSGNIITSGTNIYAGGNYGWGYAALQHSGNATNSGYAAFHAPNNLRAGFLGYADTSWLYLNSENGRNLRFTPGAGLVHVSGSVDVAGVIRGQIISGQGDVLVIGNDSKLVDINVGNMAGLQGFQDPAVGGLTLGTGGGYVWGASNSIGINTQAPAARLDVNGEVRVGSTSLACAAGTAGAIQYSGGTLQYCNGTSYVPLAGTGSLGSYVAKVGDTMSGHLAINNGAPTLTLQDTDQRSGYIHVNGDLMYFIGSGAANAGHGGWVMNGGHWPLLINLANDQSTFGGNVLLQEGNLTLRNNGAPMLLWDKNNGQYAYSRFTTGGSTRWDTGVDSANETGSNAGSNFFINRFDDAGNYLNTPFIIYRSSGDINLNGNTYINGQAAWNAGNDGAGSGLDADTLDGLHASSFVQTGAETDPQVAGVNAGNACIGNGSAVDCSDSNVGTKDDITTRTPSGFWQSNTPTAGEGWPATIGGWVHLLTSTHSNTGNYYSMQFAGDFYDPAKLFYRVTNGSGSAAWHKLWHSGNDGSGSGLDADTLDGVDSGSFLRFGQTYTGDNVLTIRGSVASNDVWSSGLEITEVNGVGNTQLGPEYAPALTFHWQGAAASSIKMYADTSIRFRDQSSNATSYRDIYARDVYASRNDGTGVLYLNNAANRYLYYDGTAYQMPGANLFVNGSQVATAAGLANYVAKAGDTMTGTLNAPNITVGTGWDYAGTEIRSYQTGFPYIDFSLNNSEDYRVRQYVDRGDGGLRFQGADGNINFTIHQNGILSGRNSLNLGSAVYQTDGNIYMPWLGDWLSNKFNQDVRNGANPTFGTVYTNNWFRSSGNSGWINETHSGGWYMSDSTWVRSYNNKSVYTPATMRADTQVQTANVCDLAGANCSTPAAIASAAAAATNKVDKSGDTMSGNLIVNARVGIGTSNPQVPLDVSSTSGYAIRGITSANTYGIFGQSLNAGQGGVMGMTANGSYYGILGYGNAYSFYGNGQLYNTSSNGNSAVYANSTGAGYAFQANAGSGIGGYFLSASNASVYAESNAGGGYTSVVARALNGGGSAFLGHNTAWNYYCYVGHYQGYSLICSGPTSGVSDGRLKKDITPLKPTEGLDAIMALKPVHYRWKGAEDQRSEFGFIAQDVEKVLPGLVGEVNQDASTTRVHLPGGKQKILNYERIIAPTVLAIQQLKAENDNLRAANDEVKASNAALKASNDNLVQSVEALARRLERLEAAGR